MSDRIATYGLFIDPPLGRAGMTEAEVGIWALGDCNGCGPFTHTSYNDFEIVAGSPAAMCSSQPAP